MTKVLCSNRARKVYRNEQSESAYPTGSLKGLSLPPASWGLIDCLLYLLANAICYAAVIRGVNTFDHILFSIKTQSVQAYRCCTPASASTRRDDGIPRT
jgi:hypothetical protein